MNTSISHLQLVAVAAIFASTALLTSCGSSEKVTNTTTEHTITTLPAPAPVQSSTTTTTTKQTQP